MNRPGDPALSDKLRFDDEQPAEAPATSGQLGQKSKRRKKNGKLQQDAKQPRPSGRLRQENIPPPVVGATLADKARKASASDKSQGAESKISSAGETPAALGEGTATPGENPAAAGGEAPGDIPGSGSRPADKKVVREAKKLGKSKFRAEQTEEKLGEAREKLAKQKPPKKPGVIKKLGNAAKTEAWVIVHGKIYRAEDENVGVKAAHRVELAGEGAVQSATRFIKRQARTRPARIVRKWEKKDAKAHADYQYRKTAQENPQFHSNPISRRMQKRKLQKQYRKQARGAAEKAGTLVQRAAETAKKIGGAMLRFTASHPVAVLIVIAVFIIIATLQSCVAGGMTVGQGLLGALGGVTYMAEDGAINEADLMYSIWETDLLYEAQNAEESHSGYDEYIFNIDPVGHDPVTLISFLTTKYDDFTFAEVEPVLRDIFETQYELTFDERIEERVDEDGESYDWYILEITLTVRPFDEVLAEMLAGDEEEDRYDIYNETGGNRAYAGSPFAFDWRSYVSCLFGWRVHPVTGEKDFHRAIDIAVPAGTDILAGGDGVVIEATTHSLYGLTVRIDYGEGGDPAGNITARYSHCSALLVSVGQTVEAGDVIARVGSTGQVTGAHLDIEILKDGELMNPLYFLSSPR